MTINPLDSNKTINNNQNITSTAADEPNMKIAKMSSSQSTSQTSASNANKKNDKKKALKRL